MRLSFFALILAGCEPAPMPQPTPTEVTAQVAVQAATSRGYVIHICAKPVRDVAQVDVTWKGINVVEGKPGWSDPQKLALVMPIDAKLCGNPNISFSPAAATKIAIQLDDMSAASGIWIRYPFADYADDDANPNAFLSIPTTDDDGWFTFAVYPVQRGIPMIPIGTVRPGHALTPPMETKETVPAPSPD
ncbi:hypothetical protein EBS80_03450 [bacterium]|nr:hypothetical protein [bacterium]